MFKNWLNIRNRLEKTQKTAGGNFWLTLYREIYSQWQTIPCIYDTLSKETAANTSSTTGFK